ncbi:hypothetical protein BJX70DRAFT_238982 [Aspergillus crustosus]
MERVDSTYREGGQRDLASPPPDTNSIEDPYSDFDLSWMQHSGFHLDGIDDALRPTHQTSSFLTAQLLDKGEDAYSAVDSSDSCASWLSFLHSEGIQDVSANQLHDGALDIPKATDAPTRTPRHRLPTNAVRVLKSWFRDHRDDPYPSEIEKERLARQTGLSLTQISNWFNNARRSKGRSSSSHQGAHHKDNSLMSPMERWKNSPPETEAAATADIIRALNEKPPSPNNATNRPPASDAWSSNSSGTSFVPKAASLCSIERSHSSGSELNFNRSQQYQRPPTPVPGKRSRRRRKFVRLPKKEKSKERRPYQCTFCADSFLTKYDWQRHEKALHLPIDRWVCSPDGGIVANLCTFCDSPDTSPEHLARHNILTCHIKPAEERIFFRKDHLKQHLKLTHNVGWIPSMEQWRQTRNEVTSRCGFCATTLSAWDERVDHIAEHFKAGSDMAQWKGDWGFDPYITSLVQNAMPPYLLGYERNTMDPWTVTGSKAALFDGDVPNALSKYTNLQRDLIAYIQSQMAANLYPSDLDLQDMARIMAYGNNDRLDQTYADDPAWLDMIKREAGLEQHSTHRLLAPPEE